MSADRSWNDSNIDYRLYTKFEHEGIRYLRHKFLDGNAEAYFEYKSLKTGEKFCKHRYRHDMHKNDKTLVLRAFAVIRNMG